MSDKLLYFSFIRGAIHDDAVLGREWSDIKWEEFFLFCQQQAIAGIVFDGIERYQDGLKDIISKELLLNWFGLAERIKRQNMLLNKRSVEATRLFASAGFKSCILKGQGNTFAYPSFYSRTTGDVDIWVDASREDINHFVKGRCPNAFEQEHHIEFPIFKGTEVEVHYKPASLLSPKANKAFLKWCEEQKEIQMSHKGTLPDGAGEICYPTAEFNVIFQLAHIMIHFFIEGIGLRHFIDYYYVLKELKDESQEPRENFQKKFEEFGLFRFARGVMWIEKECLGLEDKYLIVAPNERAGKVILTELIEGGNFGHHDNRYAVRKKGYLARGAVDVYRLLKLATVFPSESFWKIIKKVENQKWKVRSTRR